MPVKRVALILVPGLALLALAVGCTTTAPPSRLDTFLCGDDLIATERGTDPPAASCVLVTKWRSRGYSDPQLVTCGAQIAREDVRIVGVGDVTQVTGAYADASGVYRLVAPGWLGLQVKGTDAATEARARRIAASAGCPLLLLGPNLALELRQRGYDSGGTSVVRYRLFRLGGPAGPGEDEAAAAIR